MINHLLLGVTLVSLQMSQLVALTQLPQKAIQTIATSAQFGPKPEHYIVDKVTKATMEGVTYTILDLITSAGDIIRTEIPGKLMGQELAPGDHLDLTTKDLRLLEK